MFFGYCILTTLGDFRPFPQIISPKFEQKHAETAAVFEGQKLCTGHDGHGSSTGRRCAGSLLIIFNIFLLCLRYFFVVPTITLTCSGFINQLV